MYNQRYPIPNQYRRPSPNHNNSYKIPFFIALALLLIVIAIFIYFLLHRSHTSITNTCSPISTVSPQNTSSDDDSDNSPTIAPTITPATESNLFPEDLTDPESCLKITALLVETGFNEELKLTGEVTNFCDHQIDDFSLNASAYNSTQGLGGNSSTTYWNLVVDLWESYYMNIENATVIPPGATRPFRLNFFSVNAEGLREYSIWISSWVDRYDNIRFNNGQ